MNRIDGEVAFPGGADTQNTTGTTEQLVVSLVLPTGTETPTGTTNVGEDIYLQDGPNVWFQDADAPEANAPDGDGFHWGLSGTDTFPIFEIACYESISLIDTITRNPIQCDSIGVVDEAARRDSLELQLTLKSLLPFEILSQMINGGANTQNTVEGTEKFGLGEIPLREYHVFFSRIYDVAAGDFVCFTGHRAKFVEHTPLEMPWANAWNIAITMKLFADRTKPADQWFGTYLRRDPSVIV